MLSYNLAKREGLPRYEYLCRCIREDIRRGRLRPGEKLPSKRGLASGLGVAVVTVENAYAQLVAEGWLRSEEKRGYFVQALEPSAGAVSPLPAPARPRQGGEGAWLLDLRGGGGMEGFPFSVWARLMRRVLTEQGQGRISAPPHSGQAHLREALCRYLYRARGIVAQPEQIVVGAGSEYLYNLIVQMLGRELRYGVEDPGYPKAARVYGLNGAECLWLPMDGEGVLPGAVEESGVQVLHLTPSHQFPTGAVMPAGRRQTLLNWAQRTGAYLIEDDYDSEFPLAHRPIPTMLSADSGGRVIYLNTFSRTLTPSLRISYMVLPPALLSRYQERLGFYSGTVPVMEQETLARFLDEGYFERHINRMRGRYRARREQILGALAASPLAGRSRVWGDEAGLHFLLTLETSRTDDALLQAGEGAGLRLAFLSQYSRAANTPPHTLVVADQRVDLETLPQALRNLSELL